jgi:hypothetical protein
MTQRVTAYYLVRAPGVFVVREQRFNRAGAHKEYRHALRYCEELAVLRISRQSWGFATEDVTGEFREGGS